MTTKTKVAAGQTAATTAKGDDLDGRLLSSENHDSTKPASWQDPTLSRLDDLPLVVRDRRANRRYFVDNAFVRGGWAAAVGPYGISAYNVLALHADIDSQDAWPSYKTIATLAGMSRAKAIDAIEELAAWGLIRVETRKDDDKVFTSNLATLLDASQWRRSVDYVRGRDKTRIVKELETVATSSTPLVYDVHQGSVSHILPPSVPGTPKQDPSSEQSPGEQNPSSAGATPAQISDDPGQRQVVQTLNDDDDVSPLILNDADLIPEREDLKGNDPKGTALRLLAEVAPNFDQVETWIETQDVVRVGLIAASLLADPGKQRRLRNKAGFIRSQARNGFQPDDKTLAIWEKALAGADLDDDDDDDQDDGSAFGLRDWEDIVDGTIYDKQDPVYQALTIWREKKDNLILSGVPESVVDALEPVDFNGDLILASSDRAVLDLCKTHFRDSFQDVLGYRVVWAIVHNPDDTLAAAFWLWRKSQPALIYSVVPDHVISSLTPLSLVDDVLTLSTTNNAVLDLCQARLAKRISGALGVDVAFVLVDQDGTVVDATPAIIDAPVETTTVETVPVDPDPPVLVDPAKVVWRQALNDLQRRLLETEFDIVKALTVVAFDETTRTLTLAADPWTMTQIEKPRTTYNTDETWSIDGRLRQALDDVQVAYSVPEKV